jgi:tetratricopeptide (TPR) repeat protein
MRRITIAALVILFFGIVPESLAQKKKTVKQEEVKPAETPAEVKPEETEQIVPDPLFEHFYRKYVMASRWNDSQAAKDALLDLIILRPKNDSLIYTLAYYYFDNNQFAPAMLIAQDLLARNDKNYRYLELSASSFEALGLLDKALQNYETIYLLSNNTMALYKIAFLQYDLKRYEAGLTNVDILMSRPDVETIKIGFNDANNQPKEYAMKLAVLNLKGLILEAKGDKGGAKKIYEDLIKQVPDFQPALANLAALKKD